MSIVSGRIIVFQFVRGIEVNSKLGLDLNNVKKNLLAKIKQNIF